VNFEEISVKWITPLEKEQAEEEEVEVFIFRRQK
jgi:hypothetical protein